MSRMIGFFVPLAAIAAAAPAQASIVLSQVVVDILPTSDVAQNIEVSNDGTDVAYVVAEPAEIIAPGQPAEARTPIVDPGVGGLLVSPQRLILQPGERKTVRIAAIGPRGATDRVYRVTIKPVAGPVTAAVSALKLLVGYDVLVIYRPAAPAPKIVGERSGDVLTLRNTGNTNADLFDGRACAGSTAATCKALPSKRLYAGQAWRQTLPGSGTIRYRVAVGSASSEQQF
ncbi:molecular chaperone [uncultured Sphingomonas sp.]|uniref:fimbrial biogenesis chaperone n=1 Tax=uncultured Sphingomonas sp. TaxID=158754 RepID=UPI0035C9484C